MTRGVVTANDLQAGAFVALGTNLPHGGLAGPELLRAAVRGMQQAGLIVRRASSIWETDPWPPAEQNNFHNAVVELGLAGLTPQSLFEQICAIERAFGRERRERWGARTLDLDLIDFGGQVGTFGEITLPHKRTHERAFVLAPLAELGWRHPVLGRTAEELLGELSPGQRIERRAEALLAG